MMIARFSPAQERGLILLIAAALFASGILLLLRLDPVDTPLSSRAVVLDDVSILLPSLVTSGPVDVNAATAAQLISLPGIGPALAQRILDYRSAHGLFDTLQDLVEVPGIGPHTVAGLEGLAVAGQSAPDD